MDIRQITATSLVPGKVLAVRMAIVAQWVDRHKLHHQVALVAIAVLVAFACATGHSIGHLGIHTMDVSNEELDAPSLAKRRVIS